EDHRRRRSRGEGAGAHDDRGAAAESGSALGGRSRRAGHCGLSCPSPPECPLPYPPPLAREGRVGERRAMIGKLKGMIESYGEDAIVLDVNGVGYLVHCSARTLQELPAVGQPATLAIETS